jgi:hypothetical protein
MESETLILELSIEDALNLASVLDNARADCTYLGITSNFNGQLAARLLNSAIDPIITQLEQGLEMLGAR